MTCSGSSNASIAGGSLFFKPPFFFFFSAPSCFRKTTSGDRRAEARRGHRENDREDACATSRGMEGRGDGQSVGRGRALMVRDSDSATEARSIVGCRSCRASPRRSRRFARAASVASRLEVFRSTRTPVAVIGRSLVAFPRPYTRSPSAMRIVRRRRRTRHRAIASRAFAREKVMRRRKTATATNTHLLGCHGGCHSTLAVRSLHVRVLLLSVRQDVARPSARRGMIFTGSKLGTNDESTVQQLVTFRVRSGCSASQHPVVEASTELFQL